MSVDRAKQVLAAGLTQGPSVAPKDGRALFLMMFGRTRSPTRPQASHLQRVPSSGLRWRSCAWRITKWSHKARGECSLVKCPISGNVQMHEGSAAAQRAPVDDNRQAPEAGGHSRRRRRVVVAQTSIAHHQLGTETRPSFDRLGSPPSGCNNACCEPQSHLQVGRHPETCDLVQTRPGIGKAEVPPALFVPTSASARCPKGPSRELIAAIVDAGDALRLDAFRDQAWTVPFG